MGADSPQRLTKLPSWLVGQFALQARVAPRSADERRALGRLLSRLVEHHAERRTSVPSELPTRAP
jgi:hypothetical protein